MEALLLVHVDHLVKYRHTGTITWVSQSSVKHLLFSSSVSLSPSDPPMHVILVNQNRELAKKETKNENAESEINVGRNGVKEEIANCGMLRLSLFKRDFKVCQGIKGSF